MATTAKLTVEEFLALPDTKPGSELINGEIVQKPMPNLAHMIIQQLLDIIAGVFIRQNGLGISGPEGRCILGPPGGERPLLPDFLFVAREHLAGMNLDGPLKRAPDLAVEILSPDDRMTDVMDKLRFYLLNGGRLVWLIDPENRTVTVMTSVNEARILSEDDTLEGGDVLPGFTCAVRDILPPADLLPA
jgi:Uma2 family endonuclease